MVIPEGDQGISGCEQGLSVQELMQLGHKMDLCKGHPSYGCRIFLKPEVQRSHSRPGYGAILAIGVLSQQESDMILHQTHATEKYEVPYKSI